MTAAAVIAFCGTFTSCTHDEITVGNGKIDVVDNYETAFITRFGTPAETQTWGFGKVVAAGTRSASSPSVPDIVAPFSADDITAYLATAKEPNSTNVTDNYDNSYYEGGKESEWVVTGKTWVVDVAGHNEPNYETKWIEGKDWNWGWQNKANTLMNNYSQRYESWTGLTQADIDFWDTYCVPYNNNNWSFYGADNKFDATVKLFEYLNNTSRSDWAGIYQQGYKGHYEEVITGYTWIPEQGHYEEEGYWTEPTGGHWVYDENFVRNFKITGTWNGNINVVGTEGYTDGVANGNERTVVVTGKWNLTADQRVGSKGRIIVANGGELAISEGKTLEMVNQSRLVVLQGGKITGKGNIEVTNGTAEGNENYNGGEINIEGYFNNNFGKFFNYGKFKVHQYRAGGQGGASGFYNHGVVNIDNGGVPSSYVSTNARIFNACQWYCAHDMRAYILELASSSYFYVGGELEMSCGNDGSGDETYVAMAGGAYLKTNTLNNNNTNWYGTSEDAPGIVEIGKITYLNWTNETAGFFRDNLYVSIDDQTNLVDGNGMQNEICSVKFWGTPGKYLPYKDTERGGADVTVPADEDFVLGESGCAPGYEGAGTRSDVAPVKIIAEDLSVDEHGDFDFNDVVFLVDWVSETEAQITLQMAGGTLPLVVGVAAGQEENDGEFHANEVHKRFNVPTGTMVNIGEKGVVRDVVKFNVSGTFSMDNFAADCNNIRVAVKKSGEWHELTAVRGKVPSKIAVAKRYVPCSERDDIEETYPEFSKWVVNPSITWY